jgi:Tfp pilus assembly protein PilF
MSLLVDLLSKTRTKESKKDIPPGLRRTVVDGTYKKKTRRKVIILSVLVLIVFLAGFGTIYVTEMFKASLSTTIATKTHARQPTPTSNIRDEGPPNLSKIEPHVNTATPPPKTLLTETGPQEKPKSAGESSPRMASNVAKDSEPSIPATVKTQVQGIGKTGTSEKLNIEKGQQKTNKDVYLYAARTHEARSEFKQALDYYMRALELDPANYIVMNNIAGVYIRLKLYNEALSYSNKALEVKTNYVPSLINAGIAQVSLGNFSEGEGFLTRAATIEPLNKLAIFNLAVLCEKRGSNDRAYENYFNLSQMRDVDGCLGAARILERQGRNAEAARFYREILTIESAAPSIRQFANQRLGQLTR